MTSPVTPRGCLAALACVVLGACASRERRGGAFPDLDVAPVRADRPLEAGSWAVMPPLGVVLVKAVEPHPDGDTYVVVNEGHTMNVPVARAAGLGMRPLVSAAGARQVLALLDRGVEVPVARLYDKERTAKWLEAMRVGTIRGVAETFAALCEVRSERRLVTVEQGLFHAAKTWLVAELGAARSLPPDDVEVGLMALCD